MHTNIAASRRCSRPPRVPASPRQPPIGTVAIPDIKTATATTSGLFLGTIAAGGTLGILIPPSINMVLYGVHVGHCGR
jgi:C4-dicarboxylate transporter DctM subunit